jgi:flagellar motility protein MotE (MotC chaperone)
MVSTVDSLAIKDSTKTDITKSETELASNQETKNDTINISNGSDQMQQPITNSKNENPSNLVEQKSLPENFVEKTNKDSAYTAWLKRTVKLVENLSPAQASKLLKNYSDNQARDIIYTMKQKQAAKIISYLEPEYVHKLTRFQ